MDSVIDFSEPVIHSLVIEAPDFFRSFLQDIAEQIKGFSGKAVLSRQDKPIDFSHHGEIIDGFLNFEMERKQLMTRLLSRLEAAAVSEGYYARTARLTGELEQLIQELSFDLPCSIFCSKMGIGGILRAAGIQIADDYENDLERLLDYMELTRELDRDRLFIFVNLRSYYTDSELEAFFGSILAREYCVLLVDSQSRSHLSGEHRITVDSDLCEF